VPGLAARVMPSGQISFVLVARFPDGRHPTRRSLGSYGALTLEEARVKARAWRTMIELGIDPEIAEQKTRADNLRRQANTFAVVLEDYIRLAVVGPDPKKPLQRKGNEVARDQRRTFVPLWGDHPITDITRRDVLSAIEGVRDVGTEQMVSQGLKRSDAGAAGKHRKARGTPTQARNALGYLKSLFSWAIDRGVYKLEISPCGEMRAERIVGAKKKRGRILSDDEMRAFWRATGRMGYPTGPLYRLLSGLRLNEAADASRHELDYSRAAWTIPADRMKGKNATARPHAVRPGAAAQRNIAWFRRDAAKRRQDRHHSRADNAQRRPAHGRPGPDDAQRRPTRGRPGADDARDHQTAGGRTADQASAAVGPGFGTQTRSAVGAGADGALIGSSGSSTLSPFAAASDPRP
jgi:hypothetical protein